jgi:D-lactate dehydrogenase
MDNVMVTAHQAFLTNNALHNMMATVFDNLQNFEKGNALDHLVKP